GNLLERISRCANWRSGRKASRGRWLQKGPIKAGSWNCIYVAEASATIHGLNACRIANGGAKPKGSELIKGIGNTLSKMVIDNSKTAAEGRLARTAQELMEKAGIGGRRISKRKPGCEIFIVIRPIRFSAIGLARQTETDGRTGECLTLQRIKSPLHEEVMHI